MRRRVPASRRGGPLSDDLRSIAAALRAAKGGDALSGAALRAALTDAAQRWIAGLFGDPGPAVALVMVGAYGRGEPAFGSDLDLVLVHERPAPDIAPIADALWYPIWDAGLRLDHSVRTSDEALAVADGDLAVMLGLLDTRHVAGDRALSAGLHARALERWRSTARRRLPELREACVERGKRFGELAFLLEPDLKNARGGLRDGLALTQAAAAQVVDRPGERLASAYRLLLDVRGETHRLVSGSRQEDRLLLQSQDAVARLLPDIAGADGDPDELMAAVSLAGRTIAFGVDELWRRVAAWSASSSRWRRTGRRPQRTPLADGVVSQDGEVVLALDADPGSDPALPLRAAAAAARSGLPISPFALERLRVEGAPVPVPWSEQVRDAFVGLLAVGPPAIAVWEALDQAGLIEPLLPEWDRVRCRPQRNAYHRFTVDRHLVEAAAGAAALTRRVARPDLLLLGGLLHDIGKGWPGDHTDAGIEVMGDLGPRLGLPAGDVDTLIALIRHHLLLPDTAVRRDLADPATAAGVADAVGSSDVLDLLHALTEADSLATGPAAWSAWKAGLISELVRRTHALLDGQAPPARVETPLTQRQRELLGAAGVVVAVAGDLVEAVADDVPGLLAAVAGVLALHRLDIRSLDARAEGRRALVVARTTIRPGREPDPALLRDDLRRGLSGDIDLAARLAKRRASYPSPVGAAPPLVLWVDGASAQASVVEVRAPDGVGVLHRVTAALAGAGVDVRAARCSTIGADVIDAFYLIERDGGLVIFPERRRQVAERVLAALAD